MPTADREGHSLEAVAWKQVATESVVMNPS
jgi:hypothetical protein